MFDFRKTRKRIKTGRPPGSLIYTGETLEEQVKISVFSYDENNMTEISCGSIEEAFTFKEKDKIYWLNISGLHNVELLKTIGNRFDIHPLILEDILNTEQRPKVDDLDDYLFLELNMITYNEPEQEIK